VRVVTTLEEARQHPDAVVWATGPEWDDFSEDFDLGDRNVAFVSSWQHAAISPFGLGNRNPRKFIIPKSIKPVEFGFPGPDLGATDVVPKIVWRGHDASSLTLLLAVLDGLKWTKNDVRLVAFGEPSPMAMPMIDRKRDQIVTEFTEEAFERELTESHVFAYPAMRYVAQDLNTIRASSAGCLCVVPNHSGFREALGVFGFYVPHSEENVEYAANFARTMQVALESIRTGAASVDGLETQKKYTDLKFAQFMEDAAWSDAREIIEQKY
jgi:hypothetical protein